MDSLTQLQDWLDYAAEKFYVSVGVLQRDAPALSDGQGLSAQTIAQISTYAKETAYVSKVISAIIAQVQAYK